MRYGVVFETFAERHFIRTFEKKYKGAWDRTRAALEVQYAVFDLLFQKSIAETICDSGDIKICKASFKIAGSQDSPKTSGNRCIVAVHKASSEVRVLLVFAKTDVRGDRETDWWKSMIRDNYQLYSRLV